MWFWVVRLGRGVVVGLVGGRRGVAVAMLVGIGMVVVCEVVLGVGGLVLLLCCLLGLCVLMLWLLRRRGRIRMVSRKGGLLRRADGASWSWMLLRMGRKTWEVRRTGTSGVTSGRRRRSR